MRSRLPFALALASAVTSCSILVSLDDLRGDAATGDATDDGDADDAMQDAAPDAPSCDAGCTLVTKTGLAPTIATDGTLVFFRTAGEVWSCATTGCAVATQIAATSTTGLHAVAAASNLVVWTDGNVVYGCAPGDCSTPKTFTDFSPKPATGLAASTASTFVLASGGDSSALLVHRITLDGQTDTLTFSGNPGGGAPGPVAAAPQSQHVYWSQVGTPTLYDCTQPQCASPLDTLPVSASPNVLAATGSSVLVPTNFGLLTAPSNLASFSTLVSGSIAAAALPPSSPSRVYFATGTTIESCSTTAPPPCTPTTHYVGTSAITAIAAHDTSLYWIEASSVMRLEL